MIESSSVPAAAGNAASIVLATPSPVTHRTAEENLGLGYLAAFLRGAGYRVEIVDGWLLGLDVDALAAQIIALKPMLLGFACYRSNMQRAIETMHLVRDGGVHPFTVAGGYGPTFHTNDFLDAGFDAVVRGEGELPMRMLADHLAGRPGAPSLVDIPGLSWCDADGLPRHSPKPAPKLPIESLPHPHRDTLALTIRRRSLVHLQTARGCQASCTFCSIVAFERVGGGATWRQRGIKHIADELEALWDKGARYFKIIDDSLIEPPRGAQWCADLADELSARGIQARLRGSIRADRADEDVVRELARAGFFSFSCGIENFSESALRRMAKRADVAQNHVTLDRFQAHGIYVQAGHILFDDRTSLEELEENYSGMCRHPEAISKGIFTEMYAAAGTNFTRRLTKRGALEMDSDSLGNTRYEMLDPRVRPLYRGLKRWQKAHAGTYDKAIDPLSAPKALDDHGLAVMHQLYREVRHVDLGFFRQLLDTAAGPVNTDRLDMEVDQLLRAEIERTAPWYADFDSRVQSAYDAVGLSYDAEENPFLC
ncbi:B12-binding domain-containing radical SAM protein [Streptomyces sp. NPDC057433]|uniref:B12-binding domain-containing radical SAM protein n=1 Tax=Streptomyces sp. NPDC057433 TaxID=3346132 RepID=UPI00367C9DC3